MNNDYDYGRSSGLYEAATAALRQAVDADNPAVKEALCALREEFISQAEAITAEIRDREQVAA